MTFKKDKLFVAFTMDVERIAAESPSGGPIDWQLSEDAINSYAEFLNSRNFYVSYFIVPYATKVHNDLFKKLIEQGNEAGLHFHFSSFKNYYNFKTPDKINEVKANLEFYQGSNSSKNSKSILDTINNINSLKIPLGLLSGREQFKILKDALEEFRQNMGFKPEIFRPGFFSLNDESYPQLVKLGFKAGSTSMPGRYSPQSYGVNWRKACRMVHKTNNQNKNIEGDLDFVEVPVTSHLNPLGIVSKHGDIRIERLSNPKSQKYILNAIKQSLKWQKKHHSKIYHLLFFTHNTSIFNYESSLSKKGLYKGDNLKKLVNVLIKYADLNDYKIVGSTLMQIRKEFLN
ncbi:MAG: hypothetical protein ACTSU2_13100 [Promethearchaeota archaeon]